MNIARVESLTVAMALAPGVYVRNRMFDFFRQSNVRRARTRASILRGIVPQLARATGITLTCDGEPRTPSGEPVWVLRYAIADLRMSRVVELAPIELSALRLMCARAGVHALAPEPADRQRVDSALARLLEPGDSAQELAIAARANNETTQS